MGKGNVPVFLPWKFAMTHLHVLTVVHLWSLMRKLAQVPNGYKTHLAGEAKVTN